MVHRDDQLIQATSGLWLPKQEGRTNTEQLPSSSGDEQNIVDNQLNAKDIATLKCEILMKEVDIRSAEINARVPSQMQTIASLATFSGGFVAFVALLFKNPNPVITVIPWAPIIGLIYSFIVLTFAWTNLDHDIQMADNGNYLDDVVRSQFCGILDANLSQDKKFFSWGYYRIYNSMRLLYIHLPTKNWWQRWLSWKRWSSMISSLSRYGFMFVLSGITLAMAVLITVIQWESSQWKDSINIL